jgi:hypothetical protein
MMQTLAHHLSRKLLTVVRRCCPRQARYVPEWFGAEKTRTNHIRTEKPIVVALNYAIAFLPVRVRNEVIQRNPGLFPSFLVSFPAATSSDGRFRNHCIRRPQSFPWSLGDRRALETVTRRSIRYIGSGNNKQLGGLTKTATFVVRTVCPKTAKQIPVTKVKCCQLRNKVVFSVCQFGPTRLQCSFRANCDSAAFDPDRHIGRIIANVFCEISQKCNSPSKV